MCLSLDPLKNKAPPTESALCPRRRRFMDYVTKVINLRWPNGLKHNPYSKITVSLSALASKIVMHLGQERTATQIWRILRKSRGLWLLFAAESRNSDLSLAREGPACYKCDLVRRPVTWVIGP